MSELIKEININDIFRNDDKYIIPIYQRKYAWTDKEIEQLLEDISNINATETYYLGTFIVDKNDDGKYAVIDGQQRLTTLFLLSIYLNNSKNEANIQCNKELLSFEARKNYDEALKDLEDKKECNIKELSNGYNYIKNYILEHNNKDKIISNLKNTYLIRVQVPKKIDLNHYFEIMNTRGEQLELHHIAKANFISAMKNNKDKSIISTIWDACANMDSYVQMNFKKDIREKIFTSSSDNLNLSYDLFNNITLEHITNTSPLKDIINNIKEDISDIKPEEKDDEDNYRFKSIMPFPYFLLYVNAVLQDNNEVVYDDKKLLNNLKKYWEDEESAKKFIYKMLQCRFLFDKYIVKGDYQDEDDNLKLSLKKYNKSDSNKEYYVNTYSKEEENECYTQDRLLALQSILRITYTSPRNMQWVTLILKHLLDGGDNSLKSVTNLLEKHCINKIKSFYECDNRDITENDLNKTSYYNIQRIVFTYLDYILWRDGYKDIITKQYKDWKIKYRTSIEHFQPQTPAHTDGWDDEYLHCFGNLALVTTSGNSRFSNLNPDAKVKEYKNEEIITQNPKLKIMANISEKEHWKEVQAQKHQKEMFDILIKEINHI